MIPNLLLFCLLYSCQSSLLYVSNYCVICFVDTVTYWWFRVDCLSDTGPLGSVFLKTQKRMGSMGEDYHTEFKFNSQGPSLYMSDNLYKGLSSPRLPSRQWRPVTGPCVTFITVVAEKSCLVAIKVQAFRVEGVGGDPESLLFFLSFFDALIVENKICNIHTVSTNTILLVGSCLCFLCGFLEYYLQWIYNENGKSGIHVFMALQPLSSWRC